MPLIDRHGVRLEEKQFLWVKQDFCFCEMPTCRSRAGAWCVHLGHRESREKEGDIGRPRKKS